MDLTVGVGCALSPEVLHVHGDHSGLFLLHVEELNESFLQGLVEVHVLRLHLEHMCLLELDAAFVNDEEGPLDPACVRVEPDFFVQDVSHDGNLLGDLVHPSEFLN